MGYADNDAMCRVDFFREHGKWYATEAVDVDGLYNKSDLVGSLPGLVRKHLNGRMSGMWAVCLEPYHKHAYPIMFKV